MVCLWNDSAVLLCLIGSIAAEKSCNANVYVLFVLIAMAKAKTLAFDKRNELDDPHVFGARINASRT